MSTLRAARLAWTGLLAGLLCLGACAGEPSPADEPTAENLAALRQDVARLRQEVRERDARLREDLTRLRQSLDGVRELLLVAQDRDPALEPPPPDPTGDEELDRELDRKTKTFVSENLDRLMRIIASLLDRLERELDRQSPDRPGTNGNDI